MNDPEALLSATPQHVRLSTFFPKVAKLAPNCTIKKLTKMYFTYVVRPGELPVGRSPQCKPFWDELMTKNLRLGTLLQIAGFFATLAYGLFSASGLSFYKLTAYPEARNYISIVFALIAGLLHIAGALFLSGFRNVGDDEASIRQTRGYRAGIKSLFTASILDAVAAAIFLIGVLTEVRFFDDSWELTHTGGNPANTFHIAGRLLHFSALLMYSVAYFFMEGYHSIGTAELWGWGLGVLYKYAALALFARIAFNNFLFDLLFTGLYGLGLVGSFVWAMSFEPMVNKYEVALDQSALRNEWFKSKNAMSYYGPPIEDQSEFIKH